jgi:uncharacterized membrane protein YdjX (TVP38/TMEM64 family)
MKIRDFYSQNRKSVFLGLFISLAPFVFSSLLSWLVYRHASQIAGWGIGSLLALYACLALSMSFSLTPTTLVSLLSGYFLGWPSLPFLIPSYLLASLLAYGIAQKADGGDFLKSMAGKPSFEKIRQGIGRSAFWAVFFGRLSPVLPFGWMNLLFALMRVPKKTFLTAGLLGMLPRTCLALEVGRQTYDIQEVLKGGGLGDFVPFAISVALLVFSSVALGWLGNRWLKQT